MNNSEVARIESTISGATVRLNDSLDDSFGSADSGGHVNRVFGDTTSDDNYSDASASSPTDPNLNFIGTKWNFDCTWINRLSTSYVFGSGKTFGPPLLVRLYIDDDGGPKAQIGDFRNVRLNHDEIACCISGQPRFANTTSLALILEDCTTVDNVLTYLGVFSMVLKPFRSIDTPIFEKCVFSMDNYTYASGVLGFLKTHLNSLLELDIGYPLDHNLCVERNLKDISLEAAQIEFILNEWLGSLKRTIRCLRIYEMISLTNEVAAVINHSFKLMHLAVSKVYDISDSLQLTVRSMEYHGQNLAYTDSDIRLFKHLPAMLPYCRHFSFVGVMYHPCINSFLGSRYLLNKPGDYHIYQPANDIVNLLKNLSACYKLNHEVPELEIKRRKIIDTQEVAQEQVGKFMDLVAIKNKEVKLRIYRNGEQYRAYN